MSFAPIIVAGHLLIEGPRNASSQAGVQACFDFARREGEKERQRKCQEVASQKALPTRPWTSKIEGTPCQRGGGPNNGIRPNGVIERRQAAPTLKMNMR